MSQNLMIPDGFAKGAVSTKFAQLPAENLGEGIKGGFGVMGYKGKVWSTKFQGDEKAIMRADGDGAVNSIEVVIVKSAPNIAKIFYESGFVDGSTAPPDCWSTNGVNPDAGASKKQSATCAGCPKNAWGSKITEAGKQTKACSDSKRLAVVPVNDMANELMGGPMLLRVPAASLKDLKSYGDQLQAYGFPYFSVATRISFDVTEAFPKFVFAAMRPLTDVEADVIIGMRDDGRVSNILNTAIEIVHHEPDVAVPSSPFENGAKPAATTPAPVSAQTTPAAQPATATQPVAAGSSTPPAPDGTPAPRKRRTKAEMEAAAAALAASRNGTAGVAAQPATATQPVTAQPVVAEAEGPAPADFDAMLDNLLP
jgi:hypothetical protein